VELPDDSGFKFVTRVKNNWKIANRAPIGTSDTTYCGAKVRICRFFLKDGTIETLMANALELFGQQIGRLYRLRWGIEVKFDTLKNKIQPENFSGKTKTRFSRIFGRRLRWLTLWRSPKPRFSRKLMPAHS
jgi:IS4 transposase